jgi:hypothetical protein
MVKELIYWRASHVEEVPIIDIVIYMYYTRVVSMFEDQQSDSDDPSVEDVMDVIFSDICSARLSYSNVTHDRLLLDMFDRTAVLAHADVRTRALTIKINIL